MALRVLVLHCACKNFLIDYHSKGDSDKMLPPVRIKPRPLITSDSKSNTILSGLTWHLLVTLGSLYSHALLNHLSPKIKWCMNRTLKISSVAHVCEVVKY